MERIVDAFFSTTYAGKTRMMFYRSQITALLSHFFGQLAIQQEEASKPSYQAQLNKARDILLENIENPPSLSELSKEIGFNTTRLKKKFKAFFGVPVFKYLQNERLSSAHQLISQKKATVQEAAWHVGYDSLSSFSNAFSKKFGYRPSQIK
jgi:AraC-like DNA-binding protein